jgi:hypothetical protein
MLFFLSCEAHFDDISRNPIGLIASAATSGYYFDMVWRELWSTAKHAANIVIAKRETPIAFRTKCEGAWR